MSVPRNFRQLGDFHLYYSGKKRAPVLTIVIGGNHEASNYLSELYHGGWLAPNIFYLGAVGMLRYGPLRICGLSGIFDRSDYRKPRSERLPYSRDEVRTVCHVRESDAVRLLQVRSPVDIGLSHDWPRRIDYYGDSERLFAARPSFFESAKRDRLGSEPAEDVLNHLRPRYWFSGHMHTEYEATIHHEDDNSNNFFEYLSVPPKIQKQLPKSIRIRAFPQIPTAITNTTTHFLGLDKPGPARKFLDLLEVESLWEVDDPSVVPYLQKTSENKYALHYDEEWLSIVRSISHDLDVDDTIPELASLSIADEHEDVTSSSLDWIRENVTAKGLLRVPDNFEVHAPPYDGEGNIETDEQPPEYPNSQTEIFCKMLGISNGFMSSDSEVIDDDYVVFE